MRVLDVAAFAWRAVTAYRLRAGLLVLAMAVGVAAVVVLTALGEGARRYVTGEFAALGTHLLIVLPGRNETAGGAPPIVGATPRDLTLEDARALLGSGAVERVAPINVGEASVSHASLSRDSVVLGTTAAYRDVRQLDMTQGRFLPAEDITRGRAVAVIGVTLRNELFGNRNPVGEWVRIGDRRFRVIGVLRERGQSLGVDMDEVAVIPVAGAQALFNTPSLFRIMVQARSRALIPRAQEDVRRILRERHEGEEDVTVITQDSLLAAFDRILRALTLTVAGIAAVSLLVAGLLVMNVMLIAVSQRTAEVGLLRALGATGRSVRLLFITEATWLAACGALLGTLGGVAGTALVRHAFPLLPATAPVWAIPAAVITALVTGLVFAWLPARRAARLDPVAALGRR